MARKKKMGPADVLEMFIDCYNEAEAEGFETAQNAAKGGEPCGWYDAETGAHPEPVSREGSVMRFQMPDGSEVEVTARRVRKRPSEQQGDGGYAAQLRAIQAHENQ